MGCTLYHSLLTYKKTAKAKEEMPECFACCCMPTVPYFPVFALCRGLTRYLPAGPVELVGPGSARTGWAEVRVRAVRPHPCRSAFDRSCSLVVCAFRRVGVSEELSALRPSRRVVPVWRIHQPLALCPAPPTVLPPSRLPPSRLSTARLRSALRAACVCVCVGETVPAGDLGGHLADRTGCSGAAVAAAADSARSSGTLPS